MALASAAHGPQACAENKPENCRIAGLTPVWFLFKDPDWNPSTAPNNYTTVEYNYDFGAQTRVQGPPPAGQSQGAIQTFLYDSAGRLQRVTNGNNGAYTRYEYGTYYIFTYASVNNLEDTSSTVVFDGLGRVIGSASDHPGSRLQ